MEEVIITQTKAKETPEGIEIVEIIEKTEAPARRSVVLSFEPRRILLIVTIILALAALYFGKGLLVAAVVNNKPIGRAEVIKSLEKRSGKAALTAIINNRLIDDAAAAQGITVSNDDVQAEVAKIETGLKGQGMSLEAALEGEGMSRADLEEQILSRKKVEKLLGDRISVSDADVENSIKENKLTLEKGKEAEQKAQIKEQLAGLKLSSEAPKLLEELTAKANIRHFVNY